MLHMNPRNNSHKNSHLKKSKFTRVTGLFCKGRKESFKTKLVAYSDRLQTSGQLLTKILTDMRISITIFLWKFLCQNSSLI